MITRPVLTALVVSATAASAAVSLTETYLVPGAPVPDNDPVGLVFTVPVGTGITLITQVEVTLLGSGGWNGDLYAYITHQSGFAVLLNRPGRSAALPDGSASSGLSITLADAAAADVHTALPTAGPASGSFQPDARTTDPALVLDSDPRSAFLSSFEGLDANGDWTLFIADLSPGETVTLESWSLSITGIPEPAPATLAGLGLLALFRRRRPANPA